MTPLPDWISKRIAKHGVLAYGFLFLALFISTYIDQNIYYTLTSQVQTYLEQKRQTQAKEESAKNYRTLLENQAANPNTITLTPIFQKKARGKTPITIVLVKPELVSDTTINPLVHVLKDTRTGIFTTCSGSVCQQNMSLGYINTFLSREANRHEVSDFDITLEVLGVYALKNLEKIGDFANLWNKDPFGVAKVQDGFESLVKEHSIDPNGVILFLYFDDSFDAPKTNADRFYDHKKFRSFANEEKSRAYIDIYDFSPFFAKNSAIIVAHELLHLFGASDKYLENSASDKVCSQKGLGQPYKSPLYPQTTGDIMCLFVEKNKGVFTRGSFVDNTLVINDYTAREIGWKD